MANDGFVLDLMSILPTVSEKFTDFVLLEKYVSEKFPPRDWSEFSNNIK